MSFKLFNLLNSRYAETGEVPVYGTHSILPKEHGAKFFALPVVRHLNNQVGAIANWDSSIHDSVALNTVSSGMLQLLNIFTSLVKKRIGTVLVLVGMPFEFMNDFTI